MKRFYLFLGLLCTTTGASYAVQNNQYARVSTTKQTTGISETKKGILPTKKNTDTPVLSAVVRSGTGTLGSLSANNDEQRLSLSNKTGLNKKIVQPGNSYKIPVPANIQQPESVAAATKVSALEKQIEELQAAVSTMNSQIVSAKEAAVQEARKAIADENEVISAQIQTAKEQAITDATAKIDSKINSALDEKQFLTADSLSNYATTASLGGYAKTSDLNNYATTASLGDYAKTSDLNNYATTASLGGYAKTSDLNNYATTASLGGYAKTSDLDKYATKDDATNAAAAAKDDVLATLDKYATKDDTSSAIANLNDSMKDFITSDALEDYAKYDDLKALASNVDKNRQDIDQNKTDSTELWAQVNQNKDNIASNKDDTSSAIANLNDSMKDFITSDALNDYAKEGDLKDLASNVDANKANIADNKNNIENYKNELWAQVNKNKDEIASNKDDTNSAIANLTTTITQNKTETDAAVAAAIATAKDYSNNATGELWTQVNANTNNFANYATTASLGDYAKTSDLNNYATTASLGDYAKTSDLSGYATTASLEDIQTDVDNMAQIISLTTDEAMKNSPKFNTVMTNHNIAVGIYEGDDKPKTNP